jgi:cytoskeletal protein CcmA (bactofilin family)
MSIFRKNEPPAKPRERPAPPATRGPTSEGISIIAPGMLVVGDITTEGTVRVEGQVRGTIRASKSVVLGSGGSIEGNILTEDAIIGGSVDGSIVAAERLELQSTCTVTGEITARVECLKLEEGARFAGQVQMIDQGPDATAEKLPDGASAASHPGELDASEASPGAGPTVTEPADGEPAAATDEAGVSASA